jgi:hypothetical protein
VDPASYSKAFFDNQPGNVVVVESAVERSRHLRIPHLLSLNQLEEILDQFWFPVDQVSSRGGLVRP